MKFEKQGILPYTSHLEGSCLTFVNLTQTKERDESYRYTTASYMVAWWWVGACMGKGLLASEASHSCKWRYILMRLLAQSRKSCMPK